MDWVGGHSRSSGGDHNVPNGVNNSLLSDFRPYLYSFKCLPRPCTYKKLLDLPPFLQVNLVENGGTGKPDSCTPLLFIEVKRRRLCVFVQCTFSLGFFRSLVKRCRFVDPPPHIAERGDVNLPLHLSLAEETIFKLKGKDSRGSW